MHDTLGVMMIMLSLNFSDNSDHLVSVRKEGRKERDGWRGKGMGVEDGEGRGWEKREVEDGEGRGSVESGWRGKGMSEDENERMGVEER